MTKLDEIRSRILQAKSESQPSDELNPSIKDRRLKRLSVLLSNIENGHDVSRRDLKSVLTQSQWADFEYQNSCVDDYTAFDKEIPEELISYFDLLKQADFMYYRSISTKSTPRTVYDHLGRSGKVRLLHRAETHYESALSRLNEIVESCDGHTVARVFAYLDRPWKYGETQGLGPDVMPRAANSSSKHSKGAENTTIFDKKRANKKSAVLQAIAYFKK